MQTIVKAADGKHAQMDAYTRLLNHVCLTRRYHPHGQALSSHFELACIVANAFHEWRTKVSLGGQGMFEQFATGPLKVRLAVGSETANAKATVRGCYMICNGELLAFSNLDKGKGAWMFRSAMEEGAYRFDAFENSPIVQHAKFYGFVEYARVPNHNGAPHPDVVYLCKPPHFQQCRRAWEEQQYKDSQLKKQRTARTPKEFAMPYGGTEYRPTTEDTVRVQAALRAEPLHIRTDYSMLEDRVAAPVVVLP